MANLTIIHYGILAEIENSPMPIDCEWVDENATKLCYLLEHQYIHCSGSWTWKLSAPGAAALVAYRAKFSEEVE